MMASSPHRSKPRFCFSTSLACRLTLIFGLIGTVTIGAMGLSVYFLTEHFLRTRAADDLDALVTFYAAYTAAAAPNRGTLVALAPEIASFFAPQGSYDVRIFGGQNGTLLATTRDIGSLPSSQALAELGHRRPTLFLSASADKVGRLYAAKPVAALDGTLLAVVEVSRSVGELQSLLGALRLVLAISGAAALTAILTASYLLARRVTGPLRDMDAVTRRIAQGDFDRRLPVGSQDEIGLLAASINDMAANLARLEASRRDFMAKISHDLRTPLTAIKGYVVNLQDTAPDGMLAPLLAIEEQVDHLSRLVTDLLTLSRLQRGQLQLRRVDMDLASSAQSVANLASQRAKRQGISLVLELPDAPAPVHGDAGRLQQATVNLLDNALRATPTGGTTKIRVASTDREASLVVIDSGPGPTVEEASRAFEPYFRGPGGGSGLGLTIAREIVAAHGGRIWLRARPEGGAEAGFSLPLADAANLPPHGTAHVGAGA
jgi:signal transduction histidine kinase